MRATAYKDLIRGAAGLAILLSATTASAQYKNNAYLEAECPTSSSGSYGTKLTTTASYSGQGYIKSQGNTTAASYNNSSTDHAFYTFTTNLSGFMSAFFRVNTNGNAANDSFFYRVDGSTWETVNNLNSLGSGWRWYQSSTIFGLGAGAHTLEIANRETGLEIDKIAFLNASDPLPTGQGLQAYNCPVPLYFEAECPTTALGAYPFKRFIKTGYSGGGYLYSKGNNTGSATSSTDVAIYPFDSGTSTYTFHFRVDTNNSANDDSWFFRVDAGAWTAMTNVSAASGWRWVQGTAATALTVGRHTLEVRNREDGLNIDKIALLPSGAAAPSGTGLTSSNCDPATTIASWNHWEQTDYANTHLAYFTATGATTIDMHVVWHSTNDSGGTAGTGSGISFLGMHRAMVNDFRAFALARGQRSWASLNLTGQLPSSIPDAYNALAAVGGDALDYYSPRTRNDLTHINTPPYLTVNGGPAVGMWTSTFQIGNAGTVYAKLADIPNLDTLGRIIGESRFHRSVHSEIDGIGGTMSIFHSPSDPFFYAWHGLIDTIVDNWLKTTTGRAWMAANPGHAFLDVGFTEMHHGWNNSDWQQP
jgi:hypothetical protein